MFGKPEWFQSNCGGWFLRPKSWQGWAYALAWVAALVVPCYALLSRRQGPEAIAWTIISIGLSLWDSAIIRKASPASIAQQPFYIGDDAEIPATQLAVRKFRLPWRL